MRIDNFLNQSPMFAINRAARRLESRTAKLLRAEGLGFLDGLTLTTIFFETPKPVKPSDLAEAFGTTRGNISHCIAGLEAKGLVQRKIDPDDARAYQLVLKPAGKKAVVKVVEVYHTLQMQFENELGMRALQQAVDTISAIADME